MVNQVRIVITLILLAYLPLSCSVENNTTKPTIAETISISSQNLSLPTINKKIRYLALGDSYTIGESVCTTCRFPEQLVKELQNLNLQNTISVDIIARTGWTTLDLQTAIKNQNPASDYDFVTLLIGVNNQYRKQPFTVYEKEFKELVAQAIVLTNNDIKNLIVISIPDYAFTPFGTRSGNATTISQEIATYNEYARKYCEENKITFINITDITQQGLKDTALVANDGLHPSAKAYTLFVSRIIAKAVDALKD